MEQEQERIAHYRYSCLQLAFEVMMDNDEYVEVTTKTVLESAKEFEKYIHYGKVEQ